ncbi:OLC1v1008972C1 [Oldenlandia corymbosa var. corymbosa]|uniref:OLC1v1008972C1 n=1 Tax=Oldenlandia corymbosa var. corymbosa TaxID=529605 RepID=A0AAV1DMX5_OLDCO|nr:OLC1v1008972C1 [Oldenlandia corymbosa var. corymbosa]
MAESNFKNNKSIMGGGNPTKDIKLGNFAFVPRSVYMGDDTLTNTTMTLTDSHKLIAREKSKISNASPALENLVDGVRKSANDDKIGGGGNISTSSTLWWPGMDNIVCDLPGIDPKSMGEKELEAAVNAHIHEKLYGPSKGHRLPAFTEICP